MLVDTGLQALQDLQLSFLGNCRWKLFPANTVIATTTVLADLGAEAAWTGYVAVIAGTWNASIIVDPRAVSTQASFVTFFNTSGSPQTFYVVALVDQLETTLIWAQNVGSTSIADGGQYTFGAQISDKQE